MFLRGARNIPYSWKIRRGIKFGSLAVKVETAILNSTNTISYAMHNDVMHNDVMHAVALLDPSGASN